MLTGNQYRQSLADGRRVFFQGQEVDVLEHEIFQRSIRNVARTYDKYFKPEDGAISEYCRAPRSVEEMTAHAEHKVDVLTSNTYGSLMTLLTSADRIEAIRPEASAAMREYVAYVQREDLRIAECITDAKGDRSKSASAQEDPDAYLRVVEQRPDGVVIRGAKLHISGAALSHELLVIPTKRMKEGEEAYSIACTVPVNAEGVKIVNVTSEPQGEANFLDAPISANAHTAMGFVIFDNVFVPADRVFLNGEYRAAATFAHALGLWVRMNGLKNMADEADVLALADMVRLSKPEARPDPLADLCQEVTVSPDTKPWMQGYDLAEEFHDELGSPDGHTDSVEVDQILAELGVQVLQASFRDDSVRGVAVAGPRHWPGMAWNANCLFNQGPQGRRFTLAHELCHLLFDRNAGRRLAIASGPWAPLAVEQRANAFAAMFLMPTSLVKRAVAQMEMPVTTAAAVAALASTLRTGFEATLWHLQNLAFVVDFQAERIRIERETAH